ncbi:hypothetical protein Poli38472_006988 [Pythium oligandrum]|uniref:FAD-binding FR-type domain-containing protein n=1 Tax=Pythium oligandrum TaxID=41045 RepID=A0A8K1FHJ9_PYTOL|nr:hypothetical protein Poli38472_006988 [Pythium oligandrum]|eukprot:TMW58843.1 hypothetical protein Poli38472_006988 [Pythium oligandrum]
MASPSPVVPGTPDYSVLKTPEGSHRVSKDGYKPLRNPLLAKVALALVAVCIGVYIWGQFYFFTWSYTNGLRVRMAKSYGVPDDQAILVHLHGGMIPIGHAEMVRPTFTTLVSVLPVAVSVVLVEYLRRFNLRRIMSQQLLRLAMVLRRKPSFQGHVSYWSYGEWLFLVVFLLGGNIMTYAHGYRLGLRRSRSIAEAMGLPIDFNVYFESAVFTFGFNTVYNMAFLFLPATRNCMWMEFLGISYANGIKYHRWLGVTTVSTAFLHGIGYYSLWIRQGTWKAQVTPCFNCPLEFDGGYYVWLNVFGQITLLLLLIIGISSIPTVRRKFFNIFYYTHHLFILAMIFAVMHFGPVIWWVLPTLVVYIVGRAISSANAFAPIQVKELTALDNDIVKITLHRSTQTDGHFHVGQFLYINVPALSKLQWHAFTIASSPHANPTTLTLYIKSLGDWTRDLVTYANDCKQQDVLPTVYVDGYYGSSLGVYEEYSTLCLIGGGIGATPMFAILEDLVSKLSSGRGSSLRQRVVFVFSFRELSLLEELHPLLLRVKELDPHEQHFKLHFHLTRSVDEDVLARKIDYARFSGEETGASEATKQLPVYAPLRRRGAYTIVVLFTFFVTILLVVVLEYGTDGGKIRGSGRKYLWPLQQAVEMIVVFLVGLVVFVIVRVERLLKFRETTPELSKELQTPALAVSTDVATYADLLSHYNVTTGSRPDVEALLRASMDNEATATSPIGVFVSGPESLKTAVDRAVAALGSDRFDCREECFEL